MTPSEIYPGPEVGHAYTANRERLEVHAPYGSGLAAVLIYDEGGKLTGSLALNPGHVEQLYNALGRALTTLGLHGKERS